MRLSVCFLIALCCFYHGYGQLKPIVFQTDFGQKDGAVAAMKGVAYGVSPHLAMFDLTHEIPPYNIWEAAYRLNQTAPYWPPGAVFVSVVDPGVGSERRSIVAKTRSGHFFVTPDNGTLTLVAESLGIEETRIIDETTNRRQDSGESYTFHGRDVYAFTAARLAAGVITFEQVGRVHTGDIVRLTYQKPEFADGTLRGAIDVLDIQYGNIWTNIDSETFSKLNVDFGEKIRVKIFRGDRIVYDETMAFGRTFSDAAIGKPIAYFNSLMNFSIGVNQGDFARTFRISSGPDWKVVVTTNNK